SGTERVKGCGDAWVMGPSDRAKFLSTGIACRAHGARSDLATGRGQGKREELFPTLRESQLGNARAANRQQTEAAGLAHNSSAAHADERREGARWAGPPKKQPPSNCPKPPQNNETPARTCPSHRHKVSIPTASAAAKPCWCCRALRSCCRSPWGCARASACSRPPSCWIWGLRPRISPDRHPEHHRGTNPALRRCTHRSLRSPPRRHHRRAPLRSGAGDDGQG